MNKILQTTQHKVLLNALLLIIMGANIMYFATWTYKPWETFSEQDVCNKFCTVECKTIMDEVYETEVYYCSKLLTEAQFRKKHMTQNDTVPHENVTRRIRYKPAKSSISESQGNMIQLFCLVVGQLVVIILLLFSLKQKKNNVTAQHKQLLMY